MTSGGTFAYFPWPTRSILASGDDVFRVESSAPPDDAEDFDLVRTTFAPGAARARLVTHATSPTLLEVRDGFLYWEERGPDRTELRRLLLAGGAVEVILALAISGSYALTPSRIVFHDAEKHVVRALAR